MVMEAQITAAIKVLTEVPPPGSISTFGDVVRCALEAADKATWQLIDTAPKDGTRVLIWRENEDPTKGYFVEEVGGWFDDCEVQLWRVIPPTHWQPLPDPPEGKV